MASDSRYSRHPCRNCGQAGTSISDRFSPEEICPVTFLVQEAALREEPGHANERASHKQVRHIRQSIDTGSLPQPQDRRRLAEKRFELKPENAVKTQIWIAVSVYVLVAIVRKRLGLEASLYQILQILSLTLFEKVPILQALQPSDSQNESDQDPNQLILFDF